MQEKKIAFLTAKSSIRSNDIVKQNKQDSSLVIKRSEKEKEEEKEEKEEEKEEEEEEKVGLVSKANHVSSSSSTKRKGGWLAGWLAEAVVSRIRMVRSPYNGHSSDLKSVS
ncbi:hypothetical protein HZH68_014299 [Vespula germanica]|uniref:Uncharacterized protein n=1 Tax=Vespula germanica TaxID=30212 RepID=A0A834JCL1_VESGE|nr:hypothetical protein HZH68_014299 [Vespula germanica]